MYGFGYGVRVARKRSSAVVPTIPPAPVYDADAQRLFNAFTAAPTDTRKTQINTLITSLKSSGVWDKLDCLYVLAAHDYQAARLNWISDQYPLVPVNTSFHTVDRNVKGDGGSSYFTTGFNPSVQTSKYSLNSAHMMAWSLTNAAATTCALGARTATATNQAILIPNSSNTVIHRLNQTTNGPNLPTTSADTGMLVSTRVSATERPLYRNKVLLETAVEASSAVPNVPFYVFANNIAGVASLYDSREEAVISLGAGLTAQNVADYYNALRTYLLALGAITA